MKTERLAIEDLVLDHEYYPRREDDWPTVARYVDAMESGEEFPPPYVVPFEGKWLVIDGWHRVQAMKGLLRRMNSEEMTMACVVDPDLPRARWLATAVEMNIKNGRPMSMMDRMMVADRLLKQRWSLKKIAVLVRIPLPNLKSLCNKHIVEGGILKSGVAPQSGTRKQAQAMAAQGAIHSRNVYAAMDNFIGFLEAGLVDLSDPIIAPKFHTILSLMKAIAAKSA